MGEHFNSDADPTVLALNDSPEISNENGTWFELLPHTDWTLLTPYAFKQAEGGLDKLRLEAATRLRLVAFWPPMEPGNWCVWQMAYSGHALLVLDGPHAGLGVVVGGGDYSPLPRETFMSDQGITRIAPGRRLDSLALRRVLVTSFDL